MPINIISRTGTIIVETSMQNMFEYYKLEHKVENKLLTDKEKQVTLEDIKKIINEKVIL